MTNERPECGKPITASTWCARPAGHADTIGCAPVRYPAGTAERADAVVEHVSGVDIDPDGDALTAGTLARRLRKLADMVEGTTLDTLPAPVDMHVAFHVDRNAADPGARRETVDRLAYCFGTGPGASVDGKLYAVTSRPISGAYVGVYAGDSAPGLDK